MPSDPLTPGVAPGDSNATDSHRTQPLAAPPSGAPARPRRSRPKRRELFCPLHPEERLYSVSPKHHLYLTDVGQLVVRGLRRSKAAEVMQAYRHVVPLTDEWLESFWCDGCRTTTWWHVKRHERLVYSLHPISRELWEIATGVIRPEGNPTVSQFTRRQARATGVTGLRQYRFL